MRRSTSVEQPVQGAYASEVLRHCPRGKKMPRLVEGRGCFLTQMGLAEKPETSWKRQVLPQVVQVPWRSAGSRVVAFSAEHRNVMRSKWWPYSGAPAATNHIVHEERPSGTLDVSLLIDSTGAFPPSPLPGGMIILPNVIEESGPLRGARTVSPTTE